ncbi:MAG TPA: amidohydrolase family protein [Actinomycetota bacterium]|nr:amidohydrolase family protein [Actinomycetota bacterium]
MRTLYRASRVHTLSHPATGEWLLVDERHVQRVGAGDPPEADRVVELPGTTIMPGFVDAHVHLTGTGVHESGPDLGGVRSAGELLAILTEEAGANEGPVFVHGFDETGWDVPTLPAVDELNAVTQAPLVAVRADGHICLANRPAIDAAGVGDLPGLERDADGVPTGVLRREANWALQRWYHDQMGDHQIQELQLRGASLAASRGVTSLHEMAQPGSRGWRDFEVLMDHRSRLPVDVIPYVATMEIPLVIDYGLPRIGGDLSLDGSIGARTAHLAEPYVDGEGTGVAYHGDEDLAEFFHNSHLAGLQVAVHAIGDAAIEQALSSWERVYGTLDSRNRRHFRARRHRVEHFEMPTPGQVERGANLGLAISVQPGFDAAWGHPGAMYEQRLGSVRATGMNPFRTLLARGMAVGGGSDSPVTPLDPMAGILAAEGHHESFERLGRDEAIRLFTRGGSLIANLEDKKGSLEPGMQADFAAYDDDPFTAEQLEGLRPVLTVSMGREVFAR